MPYSFEWVLYEKQKVCPNCGSKNTKKNGKKGHKQQYLCKNCSKQFLSTQRLNNQDLWEQYSKGKQTLKQLAIQHNRSIDTIRRHLDNYYPTHKPNNIKYAHIIMDTTYFGRDFGIMVFMDNLTGMVLHHQFVQYETNQSYRQGIHKIHLNTQIHSITCDGRRGLLGGFDGIPTQMCQFHQIMIITRYLTKNPKHLAGQELKALTKTLTITDKKTFIKALDEWYIKHYEYLQERTIGKDGKSWYTHKRLRSAYQSLRRNLPYLFVYQESSDMIANTTNKLEGLFAHLKQSLRCHQGLSRTRKLKFIADFLNNYGV